MLRPLKIGFAEPFLANHRITDRDHWYWRHVHEKCSFVEALASRFGAMRMMEWFPATVSQDDARSLCRLGWPDVALDGIIIFPFPHLSGYKTVYETMDVRSFRSGRTGELPVCVLPHPDNVASGAMSKVTVSVRSPYYRFLPGSGSVSHLFDAIEWITGFSDVKLVL